MGFLVHTRRVGEKIRVGDDVEITVLEIDGNKVRLSFLAPREIPIRRLETPQGLRVSGERRGKSAPPPAPHQAPPRTGARPRRRTS